MKKESNTNTSSFDTFNRCSFKKPLLMTPLHCVISNFGKKKVPLLTKDFLPKFSELKVFHERVSCVKNGT